MEKIKEKCNDIKEKKLKVPVNAFNPRLKKVNTDDEKFFAYESQRSHSH